MRSGNVSGTIERRRSWRREFREAGKVTLSTTGNAKGYPWQGVLLNLSLNGMACLLREKNTHEGLRGAPLRILFCAGPGSSEFDLMGRVVSVVQAGTPNHVVVGMEFIEDEAFTAARAMLRAALGGDPDRRGGHP